MGGGGSKSNAFNPNVVALNHFEMERMVGRGGFGKVNALTPPPIIHNIGSGSVYYDMSVLGLIFAPFANHNLIGFPPLT
jgi:hypothetical protein